MGASASVNMRVKQPEGNSRVLLPDDLQDENRVSQREAWLILRDLILSPLYWSSIRGAFSGFIPILLAPSVSDHMSYLLQCNVTSS